MISLSKLLALLTFAPCILVAFDGLHADSAGTGLSKATLECFAYMICSPSVHQIMQELGGLGHNHVRKSLHQPPPSIFIMFSSGCSGCEAHPGIKLIHRAKSSIEVLMGRHDHASIDAQRMTCHVK